MNRLLLSIGVMILVLILCVEGCPKSQGLYVIGIQELLGIYPKLLDN